MCKISIFILVLIFTINANCQTPAFKVKFSEKLATLEFIERLSTNVPDNVFKSIFLKSKYNTEKFKKNIDKFDQLALDYTYEYKDYLYAQKIGGNTTSLLKRNLINSNSIEEFKQLSIGIIPNDNLYILCSVLTFFTPVYRELIYEPNKQQLEQQLTGIRELFTKKNIAEYFTNGITFYNSAWDYTVPLEIFVFPVPGVRKKFSATAFFNKAIVSLPISLTDFNKLLIVSLHEIFHILFLMSSH